MRTIKFNRSILKCKCVATGDEGTKESRLIEAY